MAELGLGEGIGDEGGGVAEDLGSGDHGGLELVVVVWSGKLSEGHRIGGKLTEIPVLSLARKFMDGPCEMSLCDPNGVFEPALRCFTNHIHW